MTHGARVAVVGAGVSGLTCATELVDRGLEVFVFDKGRAPGGRASTRRADIRGRQVGFDHGAQYFTVQDAELMRRMTRWEAQGLARRWKGRIVVLGPGGDVQSSSATPRYVGTPSMSAICRQMASKLHVCCGVTVAALEKDAQGIEVLEASRRSRGVFDAVVVTAPPVQTARLTSTIAPELSARARSVVMKPCWAIMAAFDPALDAPFDGAFVNHGPLRWIARNSSKPARTPKPDRWVFHARPSWSTKYLDAAPKTVARSLLAACFEAMGKSGQEPIWTSGHLWRYALADEPLAEGCLCEGVARVVACGDWTNGNRIEGAFLSGLQAAAEIQARL